MLCHEIKIFVLMKKLRMVFHYHCGNIRVYGLGNSVPMARTFPANLRRRNKCRLATSGAKPSFIANGSFVPAM